jgi:hypothetical protein
MNRRSEPRFDVYYRAKLIPLEQPETQVDALLTDISGSGMRLVTAQELPEGQMLCVEVGQHLVLAEVRRSVPRGDRFVIGAEKIHTLNILSLPDSISGPDRIQALVDDYHLKIQFGLEAEREQQSAAPPPPELNPETEPPPAEVPAPEAADQVPEIPPPSTGVSAPSIEEAPIASEVPATSVESNADVEETIAEPPEIEAVAPPEDPGMAPPVRTDPFPASAPHLPISSLGGLNLDHIRVVFPEAPDRHVLAEPALETETLDSTAAADSSGESVAAVPALPPEPSGSEDATISSAGSGAAELPAEPAPVEPTPIQQIWLTPAQNPPADPPQESDPLRALAIQTELAGAPETAPRGNSRAIAALAAAVVAAVALAALLFGPLRTRAMLLLPFASASEKSVNATPPLPAPAPPPAPTADATPEKENPAVTPDAPTPAQASTPPPVAQAAPPPAPANPPPAQAPSKTSPASTEAHLSQVHTTAPSWIWACTDGKVWAGKVVPGGSSLEIGFSRQAQVLIGNAAAVEMSLDGKPLGAIGPDGKARLVQLTPAGFHVVSSSGPPECGN